MTEETEKPKFIHDCDACTFLGHYNNHDLYACARKGAIDTVIARYGDDGPAYASGLIFALRGLIPELVEAFLRARKKGLVAGEDAVGAKDQELHLFIDKVRGSMMFVGKPRPPLPAYREAMELVEKEITRDVQTLVGQLITATSIVMTVTMAKKAIQNAKYVTGLEIQFHHHELSPGEFDDLGFSTGTETAYEWLLRQQRAREGRT
jgi:hypothetical protein